MQFLPKHWIILLFILLAILINLFGFMEGIDWGDDFAGYVIQSQTLVTGDFQALRENMLRNDFVLNYPWGFPTLLAPVVSQFSPNILVVKKYVFIFFIASFVFAFFLFREKKTYALLSILLISTSPYFWYFKNYLFSDMPNMFFTLGSLFLIRHLVIFNKKILNVYADNIFLGIFIFMGFWIRTQSLALLITLFFIQLFYFRKELLKPSVLLASSLPYLTFLGLRFITTMLIPIEAVSYLDAYQSNPILETISKNVIYYINIWKELFHETAWLNEVEGSLSGIFLFLFCIGISVRWQDNLLYIAYLITISAIVLTAPFYQGIRYLLPAVPFIFYFFIKGIFHTTFLISNRHGKIIGGSLFTMFALPQLYTIGLLSYKNITSHYLMDGPKSAAATELFSFLKQNTDQKSVIGYWKPRSMLLFSYRNGRIARNYAECVEKKIDYYVHFNRADVDRIPLDSLLSDSLHFLKTFQNKDFRVFKILKDSLHTPNNFKVQPQHIGELVTTIDYRYFDPSVIFEKERFIALWSNGKIKSRSFTLQKGKYVVSVFSKGTSAKGEFPLNTVFFNSIVLGSFKSIQKPTREDFLLEWTQTDEVTVILKMENDIETVKEDRNAFVYFVNIYKAE